ncbi:MAG: cytochrome c oxidase subunit II [Kiloniellales bacterium]
MNRRFLALTLLAVLLGFLPFAAQAAEPLPWQLGFQPAASPTAERIVEFHHLLLIIIAAITVFVLALLIYVIVRFNARANPTPSKTTHNTLIEVIWTVVPIVILAGIFWPSFKLLYFADRAVDAEMTLKAIGHQWYWSYEYPDHGNFTFDALMIDEASLQPGQRRLLETDNSVVVPVDTKVRLLITATDVLHSFALPAFGVKLDAVPGRLNETWFEVTQEGVYYGQCSEICGTGHSYMPIKIEAVSKEAFATWVADAQQRFATLDQPAAPTSSDQVARASDR